MRVPSETKSRWLVIRRPIASTLFVLLAVVAAGAQVARTETPPNASAPRVTGVEGEIAIGKTITVEVDRLSNWTAASSEPSKLVPYLNGRELKGLYPEGINGNKLLFHLLRTPETRDVWESLLREPVLRRPVTLSVGLENQSPFDTAFDYDHRLTLTVIPKTRGIVSLTLVLLGLVLLIYLARNTNILRDSGPSAAPGKLRPYDEGRVQMAVWFFLISSSYLCLWLIAGDLETVTPAFLGLMGISAFTALGSHLMSKPSATSGSVSAGFLKDVMSEDNDYSFLNFQMLAWTLVLGVIFVASVYDNLAMPKFSGPLLALTGISSGTYLGFKFIEQRDRTGGVWSINP